MIEALTPYHNLEISTVYSLVGRVILNPCETYVNKISSQFSITNSKLNNDKGKIYLICSGIRFPFWIREPLNTGTKIYEHTANLSSNNFYTVNNKLKET